MPAHKVRYPEGADRKLLKSAHTRTIKELERRFAADHETFLRASEHKARVLDSSLALLGFDRKQVQKAVGKQFASARQYVRSTRKKLSPKPPVRGHNPVRYPPYDFNWSGKSCGGITDCYVAPTELDVGLIGAYLDSLEAGGGASGTYVGDWFYSQSEDTWAVSVQASVSSSFGHVGAVFGYGSAYAGLQLFVRDDSTGDVYVTTTDIYNKSADAFGWDWTNFNGNLVSAQAAIPVHANAWYEVWGGLVQNVSAGGALAEGLSAFNLYITNIAAGELVIF